jgi:nitroimidazol reductase NimA-like FMN-containing flavoprotein (pyridoxamine 5'-phosphate oxidase superfamily)
MLADQGLEMLEEKECLDLLAAQSIGRVAISVGALPAIFPVNYRVVGGDVMFRTGDGLKSRAALEGNVVGFEVDDFDAERLAGWSVMIVGQARVVDDEERRLLGNLGLSPWARGDRGHLVRIHPELVSGRRIVGP